MENEVRTLVCDLLAFMADYAPYDYADADTETEAQLLVRCIETGKESLIRERLGLFADESSDTEEITKACELIRRLDVISFACKAA